MALKKTLCGYWRPVDKVIQNDDGSVTHLNGQEWVEQQEIDMHPLEEHAHRLGWAYHDQIHKVPHKMPQHEEHELMIEHGVEHVKKLRADRQKLHDDNKPHVDAAHDAYQAAHKAWCDHAEHCKANDLDPNTHEAEKHHHLVEQYKD